MRFHARSLDDIAEHFEEYSAKCEAQRGDAPVTDKRLRVGPVTQQLLDDARLKGEAHAWAAAAVIVRNTVMRSDGASD